MLSSYRIQIARPDGIMPLFGVYPWVGSPKDYPLILMFMDVNGMREELERFCKRYALAGFHVVLPDLYYRFGDGISFDSTVPVHLRPADEVETILGLLDRLTDDMAIDDAASVVDHLRARDMVRPGGVGAVGYCMGGRYVLRAMGWRPDLFTAGSAHFPTYAVSDEPDAPYRALGNASGPIYVCVGGEDRLIPEVQIDELRRKVAEMSPPSRLVVHPAAGHGYSFPLRPGVYDAAAAEADWKSSIALFDHLKLPVRCVSGDIK